ncbi:general stress protein [Bacillus infantis]|uniref:general stress protein n=1 Tax=Bacillus infantis TaxID=324767 RepID=UPI0020053D88|nr:general stress protein [Bacillus infantis]MCK6207973.1 general stress protein [Bacillus infantis]
MAEEQKHIVGVYDTQSEAIEAVEELRAQGYDTNDISVVGKNDDDVEAVTEQTGTKAEEGLAAGAAAGGTLGGLAGLLAGAGALAIPGIGPVLAAGPLAGALTGAAAGAGLGGLTGALVGMGIPEDDAEHYSGQIKEGKILVFVDGRSDKLREQKMNPGEAGMPDNEPVMPVDNVYVPPQGTRSPVSDDPEIVKDRMKVDNNKMY